MSCQEGESQSSQRIRSESHRLRVRGFIKEQVDAGRQAYIVFPLIEESETLDYKKSPRRFRSPYRTFRKAQVSNRHAARPDETGRERRCDVAV